MSAVRDSKRVAWLDGAKGLGICLIVIGHANRSIDRTAALSWTDGLRTLDTLLYAFHVPLFFVLAGVSVALARSGWRNNIASVTFGLILPYVLWSTIWIVSKALLPEPFVNQPLEVSHLWRILWLPVDHFWFLYHLVLIRMMWLVAELTGDRARQWIVLFGLIIFAMSLRIFGPEWGSITHFVENAAYFGMGFLILRHAVDDSCHLGTASLICVVIFAGLVPLQLTSIYTVSFLTGVAGACAVVFAVAYFETTGNVMTRVGLTQIGQASLVIFLLHGFAIGFVRFLLNQYGLLTNEMLLVFGSLAGVILPLLAYIGVGWFSAYVGKPVVTWIGWGRWHRPTVSVQ